VDKNDAGRSGLDRKFFGRGFLGFLEWGFGLEFDDPQGSWKIRQIMPEISWNLAICASRVKINLNCNL
jgi:hypothetical protein